MLTSTKCQNCFPKLGWCIERSIWCHFWCHIQWGILSYPFTFTFQAYHPYELFHSKRWWELLIKWDDEISGHNSLWILSLILFLLQPERGSGCLLLMVGPCLFFKICLYTSFSMYIFLAFFICWQNVSPWRNHIGQWWGDTTLTLPLFWWQSTVSPVFLGRYPWLSIHSFVVIPPPLPTPSPRP